MLLFHYQYNARYFATTYQERLFPTSFMKQIFIFLIVVDVRANILLTSKKYIYIIVYDTKDNGVNEKRDVVNLLSRGLQRD